MRADENAKGSGNGKGQRAEGSGNGKGIWNNGKGNSVVDMPDNSKSKHNRRGFNYPLSSQSNSVVVWAGDECSSYTACYAPVEQSTRSLCKL